MTKQRHLSMSARKQRMLAKRQKQLFPFNENTPLSEFINPKYHNNLKELIIGWDDWLSVKLPDDLLSLSRLDFDWSIPDCTVSNVCTDLARFFIISGGSIDKTLGMKTYDKKWKFSELVRYLASEEHGNFRCSENQLSKLIYKKIRDIINKT